MDEAPILGGGRVRKILSPYGVGGETVYTAQEDQKSINSYNMGEGTQPGSPGRLEVCGASSFAFVLS